MVEYPKAKVAAIQAAPVYLDLDATVEKVCRLIAEASKNGANLVAFPETFIPGYPYWIWLGNPTTYSMPFYKQLYKNALVIPSPQVSKISGCAKAHQIYVCVSATEFDCGSLYLAQLWFNPKGDLIGKHRKLTPPGPEKSVWGFGNGSMIPVFQTEFGRMGGLLCGEHLVPSHLMAMSGQNEQIHVSAWPAFTPAKGAGTSIEPNVIAVRYYSRVTQTFSVMTSQIYTKEMQDMLCGDDEEKRGVYKIGYGHAAIIAPNGEIISDPLPHDAEGIVYADIDLESIINIKYSLNVAGQLSHPSTFTLHVDRTNHTPVKFTGESKECVIVYDDLQGCCEPDKE